MTQPRTASARRKTEDRPAASPAMAWAERLRGTNINPETLLATDYLNHFNEAVMILDLVADMPDCIEDIADWAPKSYQDHFAHSGFVHRALAIEAYAHAPAERRAALEAVVDELNLIILVTIANLTTVAPEDAEGEVRTMVAKAAAKLRKLIAAASRIINGGELAADAPSSLHKPADTPSGDAIGQDMGQDAVDSLFD